MKEYINENKKTIIIISVFVIFIIILNIIVNSTEKNNQVLINTYIRKLDTNDIKLTNYTCDIESTIKYNNIPYLKLNNPTYNEINKEILTNSLLRSCYQEGEINFETSLNNNILSLLVNISYETNHEFAYVEYKTYNINTKTNTKMTNQQILNTYNLTLQDVNNKVTSHFLNFYKYEKDNNYIENTISFNQYLNILDYKTITLNNMNLYIDKENDLYLLKNYTLSRGMIKDDEYPNLTTKFKLT